jgi:hypothetical protein
MAFSMTVEVLNLKVRKRMEKPIHLHTDRPTGSAA